jgi:hypothetical protein
VVREEVAQPALEARALGRAAAHGVAHEIARQRDHVRLDALDALFFEHRRGLELSQNGEHHLRDDVIRIVRLDRPPIAPVLRQHPPRPRLHLGHEDPLHRVRAAEVIPRLQVRREHRIVACDQAAAVVRDGHVPDPSCPIRGAGTRGIVGKGGILPGDWCPNGFVPEFHRPRL